MFYKWLVKETIYLVKVFAILFAIAYVLVILIPDKPKEAHAAEPVKEYKWFVRKHGEILDVDPTAGGMFIEMAGSWFRLDKKVWRGTWPGRREIGTLYIKRVDDENAMNGKYYYIYKWEVERLSTETSKSEVTTKTEFTSKWQSVVIGYPPINRTVFVRYKDGITITTAYLNNKKEWKLETDRDRVLGGKTINDIKEWMLIPEWMKEK